MNKLNDRNFPLTPKTKLRNFFIHSISSSNQIRVSELDTNHTKRTQVSIQRHFFVADPL